MEYFPHHNTFKYIAGVSDYDFDRVALDLFQYQYANNALYHQYVDALKVVPSAVKSITSIPFLPVSFFKSHRVVTGAETNNTLVFASSTTTSDVPGRHYVSDPEIYKQAILDGFTNSYGPPSDYIFFALLPSYLERGNSSLVYMVQYLAEQGGHELSGFYLDEYEQLSRNITQAEEMGKKAMLIGVTFALLDFAEQYPMHLRYTIVMETGGMKGRRKELTRPEVHQYLKAQFGLQHIHSEYGMTELLSQAYAMQDGLFAPSGTMKILVRDINDPLEVSIIGSGCINIIDLANVNSCAFLATDDIGKLRADGSFEVLGRADHSALRGCNLMVL